MFVGVSRIELHVSGARSLKDKRQVMKSLAHKIGHRFNVSVSEIDHHELWQRGTLAVAHVANNQREVEKGRANCAPARFIARTWSCSPCR